MIQANPDFDLPIRENAFDIGCRDPQNQAQHHVITTLSRKRLSATHSVDTLGTSMQKVAQMKVAEVALALPQT
jgi:hypothetical protein